MDEVSINIVDKDGQGLGPLAERARTGGIVACGPKHDDGPPEAHLRSLRRYAVTIPLRKSEHTGQIFDRRLDIFIDEMRQHGIARDRAVLHT